MKIEIKHKYIDNVLYSCNAHKKESLVYRKSHNLQGAFDE